MASWAGGALGRPGRIKIKITIMIKIRRGRMAGAEMHPIGFDRLDFDILCVLLCREFLN